MRIVCATIAAISLVTPVTAQELGDRVSSLHVIQTSSKADVIAQVRAERAAALRTASVRSHQDLRAYAMTNKASALDALPADARKAFVESVTFNENGITGFRYDVLEQHLTPTQSYAVLAMFGVQHTTSMLDGSKIRTGLDDALIASGKSIGSADTYGELPVSRPVNNNHSIGDDNDGYKCVSRATCQEWNGYICMSGC